MDTSLVTNGLPEFTISGTGNMDTVGGNVTIVRAACDNLDNYAQSMDAFIEELEMQKEHILNGWSGEAATTLQNKFPGLIEAFREVPSSVRSISGWASTTMNAYVARDQDTAMRINAILGGK